MDADRPQSPADQLQIAKKALWAIAAPKPLLKDLDRAALEDACLAERSRARHALAEMGLPLTDPDQ